MASCSFALTLSVGLLGDPEPWHAVVGIKKSLHSAFVDVDALRKLCSALDWAGLLVGPIEVRPCYARLEWLKLQRTLYSCFGRRIELCIRYCMRTQSCIRAVLCKFRSPA